MSSGALCVVVTGFEPFQGHSVNSSWVAVQELSKIGLDDQNVDMAIYELPVVYDKVKEMIPQLWDRHKPVLMVHIGVSGMASEITLEQQAHNDGYNRCDVQGCLPAAKVCVNDICDKEIVSGIDMSRICEEVNGKGEVTTIVSHDAGRYLCDFTYFTSLHINRSCSAFIHVPPLDLPYSSTELATGLKTCITEMLQQIV